MTVSLALTDTRARPRLAITVSLAPTDTCARLCLAIAVPLGPTHTSPAAPCRRPAQESFRITHNRDIVPSVPLQIMGFRHVPREVWQVDFAGHEALTICADNGEDPTCHDSMCYLGLCTSIADHLVYLGAHMYRSG